jgi:hypothetical protein
MVPRLMFASVVVWFYVLGTNSCRKDAAPAAAEMPRDKGPTYVAPAGTGAATIDGIEYQYVATAEREASIIAGFTKLTVGQSREVVRKLLGPPDFAEPLYDKQGDIFRGWYYMYKIKMRRHVMENANRSLRNLIVLLEIIFRRRSFVGDEVREFLRRAGSGPRATPCVD